MGKWAKYKKKFQKNWLKEPLLKDWLIETAELDLMNGKEEAYCSFCQCYLRAHHTDLISHSKTSKHRSYANALNKNQQTSITQFGMSFIHMQIQMLSALLCLRVHCTVYSKCCKNFIPTEDMLKLFNSSIYSNNEKQRNKENGREAVEEEDYNTLNAIFESSENGCESIFTENC